MPKHATNRHVEITVKSPTVQLPQPTCVPRPKKRLINMGAGVEQRPWTPTVRRGKIAAEDTSPGPACVQLPSLVGNKVNDAKKQSAPSYTFGLKHRKMYSTLGPGPAQYNVAGLGKKGKESQQAATLQSRPKEAKKFSTPAPGEYNVDKALKAVVDSTPKYTFGQKPPSEKPSLTPAPNVYKIPTVLGVSKEGPIRSAPAFSITGREKPRFGTMVLPGPGSYDAEFTVVKKKPPVYSIRSKFNDPSDQHMKPGPGAHCPEKFVKSKSVPAPSFAILHSKYLRQPKAHTIEACERFNAIKYAWCM